MPLNTFSRVMAHERARSTGPDPRWLDPTVEGYQGACARHRGVACRCPRCEPRGNAHYLTLECGCVTDAPDGMLLFINPGCLQRAAQGRSRGLASAGSRADQAVLVQRVMALHEQDSGKSRVRRGFGKSPVSR